jgi:hypothetical protein
MRTPIFQVDAFTTRRFGGNPAAVMLLAAFPADELMQAIAAENNLAETAFLVRDGVTIVCAGSLRKSKCRFAVMLLWPAPRSSWSGWNLRGDTSSSNQPAAPSRSTELRRVT